MDTKTDPLSDDIVSQSKRECFTKQTESETVTGSNFCEIYIKTEIEEQTLVSDFASQNEREFLPEVSITKCKKYNSDHETDIKIEIKEEPLWLETEPSSASSCIKDWDYPPVTSPRLCLKTVSGDNSGGSLLFCAKYSGKDTSYCGGKELPESDITKLPTVERYVHSEQPDICNEGGEISNGTSYLKPNSLNHEDKKPYRCEICDKTFTQLYSCKKHKFIHEGKRPHKCDICGKSFTWLSNLKSHSLLHEGKKTHKCKLCDKSFTRLSDLKGHNLVHEGKNEEPYKCEACDQIFSRLSHLKSHNLSRKHYTAIQA